MKNSRLSYYPDESGSGYIGLKTRDKRLYWLAYQRKGHVILIFQDKYSTHLGQISVPFDPQELTMLRFPYCQPRTLERYMRE